MRPDDEREESRAARRETAAPAAGPDSPTLRQDVESGHTGQAASKRILLVEDDEGVGPALSFVLEDAGYEVEWLSDGVQVLERVQAGPPDLVILDIHLGEMDGRTIYRRLRAESHDVPIILMSGHAQVSASELDASSAFLSKPFETATLLTVASKLAQ
jgi:DNA-binding response OmpR family regulator